jgi:hypothetical protein
VAHNMCQGLLAVNARCVRCSAGFTAACVMVVVLVVLSEGETCGDGQHCLPTYSAQR